MSPVGYHQSAGSREIGRSLGNVRISWRGEIEERKKVVSFVQVVRLAASSSVQHVDTS